jgi:hypothetical protein
MRDETQKIKNFHDQSGPSLGFSNLRKNLKGGPKNVLDLESKKTQMKDQRILLNLTPRLSDFQKSVKGPK